MLCALLCTPSKLTAVFSPLHLHPTRQKGQPLGHSPDCAESGCSVPPPALLVNLLLVGCLLQCSDTEFLARLLLKLSI